MKSRNIRIILGLTALVFAVWLTAVLLYADRERNALCLWLSVGFTSLAFVLSALSLYLTDIKRDAGMTENNALPVLLSLAYFLMSLVANTVFLMLGLNIDLPLVILNLVLLIGFAACRVFIPNYLNKTAYKLEAVKQRTGNTTRISAQIGVLIQYANDEVVRNALRSLKEHVDYGSNIGSISAAEVEDKIMDRLSELKDMLEQKRDTQIILNQIAAVSTLLKERSAHMG